MLIDLTLTEVLIVIFLLPLIITASPVVGMGAPPAPFGVNDQIAVLFQLPSLIVYLVTVAVLKVACVL